MSKLVIEEVTQKCEVSGRTPAFCKEMYFALGDAYSEGKGLSTETLWSFKTSPFTPIHHFVVYRRSARAKKFLTLRSCPWCGANLLHKLNETQALTADQFSPLED